MTHASASPYYAILKSIIGTPHRVKPRGRYIIFIHITMMTLQTVMSSCSWKESFAPPRQHAIRRRSIFVHAVFSDIIANMLTELEINNLGPIRKAVIEPSAGMTAITGETGAGKSMLLSALTMITGGQVNNGRVSTGAEKATATGVFDYENNADSASSGSSSPEAVGLAESAGIGGIDCNEPELIMKRVLPAKGRGKCLVNDEMVTKKTMNEIGSAMITIHGQSDQVRITNPVKQLAMLDSYADDYNEINAYMKAYDDRVECEKRIDEINNPETLQRIDYLRENAGKIRNANLRPGEYADLKSSIASMEGNENIRESVEKAMFLLDTEETGVTSQLQTAASLLEDVDDEASSSIIDMIADVRSVIRRLSSRADDIESFNLDEANERLFEIERIVKRFGGSEDKALEWAEDAEKELERIDIDDEKLNELMDDLSALKAIEKSAADSLTLKRKAAAAELAGNVNNELKSLAMPGAVFIIEVSPASKPSRAGFDSVAFMFKAYENAPVLPMGESASGGELSRLMLALELSLAGRHPDRDITFVFDEVDSGIGGRTSIEIGKRLATLAKSSQVIIVTHLAQVAAYADTQYVVNKVAEEKNDGNADNENIITVITEAKGEDRVREIARMLSGDDSSEISLRHASQLLDNSKV